MDKKIEKYLGSIGLKFPGSEKELKVFNKIYEKHEYLLDESLIDPIKILDEIKEEELREKNKLSKSKSFFRRVVLAAEIVNECHSEPRFGNVKLQKMIFLCEHASNMNFETNYFKKAAGPYDNRLMHSLRTEFEKQKWFKIEKENGGGRIKYLPLENSEKYKKYYISYFSDVHTEIEYLINTLRNELTKDVELVATIFFCWAEIINKKSVFSSQLIIKKVYSFHPEKKKFSELEILRKIDWMKEKGIYPKT